MCIVFFHSSSFVYYICYSHYRVVGCCWCFTFLLLFMLPLPSLVDFFLSLSKHFHLHTAEMVVFFLIVSSFGIRFSSSSSFPTLSSMLMSWSVCVLFFGSLSYLFIWILCCHSVLSLLLYTFISYRYKYISCTFLSFSLRSISFFVFFICLWVLFCLMMVFFFAFL